MKSKAIALISSLFIFTVVGAGTVSADECATQYGGTVTCRTTDLNINKLVQDPTLVVPTPAAGAIQADNYVENITSPIFNQGDSVNFKLIVTNNSGQTFKNVKVTDNMPENLLIDTADIIWTNTDGSKKIEISSDKKSVTFTVDQLPAGKSFEALVMAKIVGAYPNSDQFCRDNWATVKSDERSEGDTNFARFCVTSKVLGTSTLPVAGANDLFMIIPFALSGLGGLALLRKK